MDLQCITLQEYLVSFLQRDALRKRGLCYGLVSVSLSVCHVRAFYPDG